MADIETTVRAVFIDQNLQNEVERWRAEGWQMNAAIPPVAVYHLVRLKASKTAEPTGRGEMLIDESKVFVLPAKKETQ